MNSMMMMALVVTFPVACMLALLGLDWLEDSLMRSISADAEPVAKETASAVVEMPVRRAEPAVQPAIAAQHRLQPSQAAS